MKRYGGKTQPKPKKRPLDYAPTPPRLKSPHPKPEATPPSAPHPAAAPKPRHLPGGMPGSATSKSKTPPLPPLSRPPAAHTPTDWSPVADSYDQLVGDQGSEYQRVVIFPNLFRLLSLSPNDRILDIACGQGVFCRYLAEQKVQPTGVDASDSLIQAARHRSDPSIPFHVADARELPSLADLQPASFHAAALVLAIQDIDPLDEIFLGASWALRPAGKLVIAMTHPAFRAPKVTNWGWDLQRRIQYRRVERYLTPRREKIIAHPGMPQDTSYTWSFHRPLSTYVKALAQAGFMLDALEEWPSHKKSDPGSRSKAEDLARSEIPLFLALRAVKTA